MKSSLDLGRRVRGARQSPPSAGAAGPRDGQELVGLASGVGAMLFPPRMRRPLEASDDWVKGHLLNPVWIKRARERLASLSWFMKCLVEGQLPCEMPRSSTACKPAAEQWQRGSTACARTSPGPLLRGHPRATSRDRHAAESQARAQPGRLSGDLNPTKTHRGTDGSHPNARSCAESPNGTAAGRQSSLDARPTPSSTDVPQETSEVPTPERSTLRPPSQMRSQQRTPQNHCMLPIEAAIIVIIACPPRSPRSPCPPRSPERCRRRPLRSWPGGSKRTARPQNNNPPR